MANSSEKEYASALAYMRRAEYRRAIDILTPLSEKDYKNSKMHLLEARAYLNPGGESITVLDELSATEGNGNAAMILGAIFHAQNNYTKAADYYLVAVKNGYWVANYYLAALIYFKRTPQEYLEGAGLQSSEVYYEAAARHGHIVSLKHLLQLRRNRGEVSLPRYLWSRVALNLRAARIAWSSSDEGDLRLPPR